MYFCQRPILEVRVTLLATRARRVKVDAAGVGLPGLDLGSCERVPVGVEKLVFEAQRLAAGDDGGVSALCGVGPDGALPVD